MAEPAPDSEAALSQGAVLVSGAGRGLLRVRGPERKTWLNGLVTCDVTTLSQGQGALSLFLNKQGKIQSDLFLLEQEEVVYVSVAENRTELVKRALDGMLIMEDAELEDVSAEVASIFLHGARSRELAATLKGIRARAELDLTGLPGLMLLVDRSALERVAEESVAAGAKTDPESWQRLRAWHGFPEFGHDYSDSDNPHEVSLERRAISWSKGCYLGQEVVCMQDMRGKVKRRLARVELDEPLVEIASEVHAPSGELVGQVTTGVRHARRLIASLKAPFFEPGQAVRIGALEGKVLALFEAPNGPDA